MYNLRNVKRNLSYSSYCRIEQKDGTGKSTAPEAGRHHQCPPERIQSAEREDVPGAMGTTNCSEDGVCMPRAPVRVGLQITIMLFVR